MQIATCDLYDEFGENAGVIGSDLCSFGGRQRFSGTAVTVKCFEDNSLVKQIVSGSGEGMVLVIDGGGSLRCALVGDMIANQAAENAWEGIIIDGCIRDRAALGELYIGVKARGSTPRRSVRQGVGQRDVQITICGVSVRSGDKIFADEDGIIVLPAQLSKQSSGRV